MYQGLNRISTEFDRPFVRRANHWPLRARAGKTRVLACFCLMDLQRQISVHGGTVPAVGSIRRDLRQQLEIWFHRSRSVHLGQVVRLSGSNFY